MCYKETIRSLNYSIPQSTLLYKAHHSPTQSTLWREAALGTSLQMHLHLHLAFVYAMKNKKTRALQEKLAEGWLERRAKVLKERLDKNEYHRLWLENRKLEKDKKTYVAERSLRDASAALRKPPSA